MTEAAAPVAPRLPRADGNELALLFVGGEWRESTSGRRIEIPDPASGELVGQAALATREDARAALEAAQATFRAWADTTAQERAQVMHRAAALLRQRIWEIARVLTLEQGKPLVDAHKEIAFSADVVDYYADEALRLGGEWRPASGPKIRSLVLKQPVGVVVAIVPWNYPIDLLSWKLAPALAAGCTVVAKPATGTPLATAHVIRCFEDAEVPPGVVNLVIGPGGEVGDELVENPISRAIKITGSTATGRRVMQLASRHIKRLTLELGGQTPLIVLDDADLDAVVPAAVRRSYSNMGQICISVNRVFVARPIESDFLGAFAEQARQLRLGHGLDRGVEYGPLFDEPTRERTRGHVDDALARGARVVIGGRVPPGADYESGWFYEPTLIADAAPEMLVMQEETFGPVAAVSRINSDAEAIELANATSYGLAAYVYGRDLERCLRIAERLEVGGVGVNVNDVTELQAPFGGWKESGLGRELGPEGLAACLESKHIRIGLGPD
jgi:succinate-semialdehyde dehydrogenase / glutarate-semialdehyde dehydrogenase